MPAVAAFDVALPLPPGNPSAALIPYGINCITCHDFNTGRGGNAFPNGTVQGRSGTKGSFQFSQLRNLPEKIGMSGSDKPSVWLSPEGRFAQVSLGLTESGNGEVTLRDVVGRPRFHAP